MSQLELGKVVLPTPFFPTQCLIEVVFCLSLLMLWGEHAGWGWLYKGGCLLPSFAFVFSPSYHKNHTFSTKYTFLGLKQKASVS